MKHLPLLALAALLVSAGPDEAKKAVDDFKQAFREAKTAHEKALLIQKLGDGEARDPGLVPTLARFLNPAPADIHYLLPVTAAEALGKFRNEKSAAQVLMTALASWKKTPFVHRRLVQALGKVGHESSLAFFEERLRGSDADLAIAAVQAVAGMPPPVALESLIREWEQMQARRERAGDDEKKSIDRVVGEMVRIVKRLSGEKYTSMQEYRIWWSRRAAEFKAKEKERAAPKPPAAAAATLPPILIVELSFSSKGASQTPNTGSSSGFYPTAKLTSASPAYSDLVSANAGPASLDFGTQPGPYAVDLEGPLEHLKNLKSFTITGWINCRASQEGAGGNRVVSWLFPGREGVEVVYRSDGGLQLGVNQPADASPARSNPGEIPVVPPKPADAIWSTWRFFAVAYDSTLSGGQARFYFGTRNADASLKATKDYAAGAAGARIAPGLSVGHVPAVARPTMPDRMFRGMLDEIRIFGSPVDGSGALTLPQVLAVQNREDAP